MTLFRIPTVFLAPRRAGAALGVGFLCLALVLMSSVVLATREQGDDALLRHALEVEVDLGDLLAALLDAEVGQRGYLLTAQPVFLDPYRTSSDRIDRVLARLDGAVSGDGDQEAVLTDIRGLVVEKRAELARTIDAYDAGNPAGALAIVRDQAGMALMDRIRGLVTRMDAEQDRLVEVRQRQLLRVSRATSVTAAGSLVLMGAVALAALSEVRKRSRLARFLPPEVAERLADGDPELRKGRSGPAAVVFVDVRGSTALAEDLDPAAVSTLLTAFREAVTAAARRHGGLVDKFLGDGALVVFGALRRDDGASAAALAFAEDLLATAIPSPTDAPLTFGVGIHHGEVFCGLVGGTERQEFTILGDTVNVASRIQAATRDHRTDLLVSEGVLASGRADFAGWRLVGGEPLRGRREPVVLYARREGADPQVSGRFGSEVAMEQHRRATAEPNPSRSVETAPFG